MMSRFLPLLFIFCTLAPADPIVSSWLTKYSGQLARIYTTYEAEDAGETSITWDHPTGNDQLSPTYSGVNEISLTESSVYIRTTGLGFHIMGPWYGGNGNLFVNYPGNTAVTALFPRTPEVASIPKTLTPGGPIGFFVDGVAVFDSRDAFSYINASQSDAGPNTVPERGDGIWNRDAYINEGVTFDPAFSHSAGNTLHYHAQAPALRYLLSDSVDYDPTTNTYTENPSGAHSPILGWMFDGYPVYGPYAYSNPSDVSSPIRRMISGYQLRDGSNGSVDLATVGRTSLPEWVTRNQEDRSSPLAQNQYGPDVGTTSGAETLTLGHYLEDYTYKGDLGLTLGVDFDLNEYNVRWCVTPEFPEGTWAYFTCIEADGTPVFPYNITRYFFGEVKGDTIGQLPENRTIIFEGGPEMTTRFSPPSIGHESGDITLHWTGVEGGEYRVERSSDLSDWELIDDSVTTQKGNQGIIVDEFRLQNNTQHFYRSALVSVDPFDDTGFDYTAPSFPTFIANFSFLPPSEEITDVTVGGVSATILNTNYNNNVLQIDFDDTSLAPGNYQAIINYTPIGSSPTQLSSLNEYTIEPRNNILLLIVDDWGIDSSPLYNSISDYPGTSFPPMPQVEALAVQGVRFTNAYAEPVCSPTRASILTGRHPFRHGVGHPSGSGNLPEGELTLPEIFAAQNSPYQLASFGKWHLGGGDDGPATIGGWPEFRGIISGGVADYYNWGKTINGSTSNETTYSTTDQVNETLSFIADKEDSPWFAWVAFNAPHTPFHNPPSDLHDYPTYSTNSDGEVTGANRRGAYEAALQSLDTEIGRLLASIDLESTNIILIGDNGTPAPVIQAPYDNEHAKASLYEGGVHVPLIIAGPDVETNGNNDELVHCVDLFSTILDLAKIDIESATETVPAIDSNSLAPIIQSRDNSERSIVSETFGSDTGTEGRTIRIDTYPDYKLIAFGDPTSAADTTNYFLYNIVNDPNEQSPLLIPPTTTSPHFDAYYALIEKDLELTPQEGPETLYLELPNNLTGPGGVPMNLNLVPNSITIDGVIATFVSRVDIDENTNRFWVKCTLPAPANAYTQAIVDFPNNTGNDGTLHERIFEATQIITPN
ncbi:sulfatase-like hydrolase/transferase [Puniceicoccaceae bacterium K14]|nr:sulfatase-like hydrolase/transferase [Puniceicoccaceae bacterium K14]